MPPVALTIAGSDPSGGAGIQADLKTFHQHRVYGCAVITLLTVQNTQRVSRVEMCAPELVGDQLDAVLEDITPHAIKTGALGSVGVIEAIATRLAARSSPLVIDPVRVAKHDATLLADSARSALIDRLLPASTLITANADEAAWLCERPVRDEAEARVAAERLHTLGAPAVLIKAGHLRGAQSADVLQIGREQHVLTAPRLDARHTHGVGCSLAAAITAQLARGQPLLPACQRAKRWIFAALASAPGVGRGIGAVDHFAAPELD